jgi:hypothetical protein
VVPAARAAPPALALAPLELAPAQQGELRLGALERIIRAEAFPAQRLRASLLASLSTRRAQLPKCTVFTANAKLCLPN